VSLPAKAGNPARRSLSVPFGVSEIPDCPPQCTIALKADNDSEGVG